MKGSCREVVGIRRACPTPFDEFVTIDTFGNQAVPTLAFSSNNGFASADPLSGSTDLGETGFFTDAGPVDHGALFDFNLGLLAPGATRLLPLLRRGAE